MPDRPLHVVTACRACDLPILQIAASKLAENIPVRALTVVSPDADCRQIQSALGSGARVIPENSFIPGLTIQQVRAMKVPQFPRGAGWYFQQLLKLQFAFVEPEDDYYLIWDADTVPLRPMRFFDAQGRMLLTRATEHHAPYFETYRRLFGEEANREFSFIAQHMLVQKSIAREMLARIEEHVRGEGNWAWKIMRALPETGNNLFSEYETYGHWAKNHHRERLVFIERSWQRESTQRTGRAIPAADELATLAERYSYVAFERASTGWRRWARALLGSFRKRPEVPRLVTSSR